MVRRIVGFVVLAFLALPGRSLAQWPSTKANEVLGSMFTQDSNFGFPPYASEPFACTAQTRRSVYYNTASNLNYFCNGTSWTMIVAGTGGTFTGPILLPDGTAAAPSLAFSGAPTIGFIRSSSQMEYVNGGASRMVFAQTSLQISSSVAAVHFGGDTYFGRGGAAATLQQGGAEAAAPVNQTLQAQGVAAGTSDVAGASYTFKPGIGSGSAVPAPLIINRSLVTTTGTTAQAQQSAFIPCGSKTLSTTSATAQTIVSVTTTTLTSGGLTLFYNVSATSATAADADTGSVNVSWNNVSGTVAATMGTVVNAVQSNSSGTLASTPTVTVATNVVSVKLTPTWATIVPTGVRGTFTVMNQGIDPIACQ